MTWGSLLRLVQVAVIIIITILSPCTLCQNTVKRSIDTTQDYFAIQQQPLTGFPDDMNDNFTKLIGSVKPNVASVIKNFNQKNNLYTFSKLDGDESAKENQKNLEQTSQKLQFTGLQVTQNLFGPQHSNPNQSQIVNSNSSDKNIMLEYLQSNDVELSNLRRKNYSGVSILGSKERSGYSEYKSKEIRGFDFINNNEGQSFTNKKPTLNQIRENITNGITNRFQFQDNDSNMNSKRNKNDKFILNRLKQSIVNKNLNAEPLSLPPVTILSYSEFTKRSSGFNSLINEFINRLPIRTNVSQLEVTHFNSPATDAVNSIQQNFSTSNQLTQTVINAPIYMNVFYGTKPADFYLARLPPGLPPECYSTTSTSVDTACHVTGRNCTDERAFFRRVHHHPEEDELLVKQITPARFSTREADVPGSVMDIMQREEVQAGKGYGNNSGSQVRNTTQALNPTLAPMTSLARAFFVNKTVNGSNITTVMSVSNVPTLRLAVTKVDEISVLPPESTIAGDNQMTEPVDEINDHSSTTIEPGRETATYTICNTVYRISVDNCQLTVSDSSLPVQQDQSPTIVIASLPLPNTLLTATPPLPVSVSEAPSLNSATFAATVQDASLSVVPARVALIQDTSISVAGSEETSCPTPVSVSGAHSVEKLVSNGQLSVSPTSFAPLPQISTLVAVILPEVDISVGNPARSMIFQNNITLSNVNKNLATNFVTPFINQSENVNNINYISQQTNNNIRVTEFNEIGNMLVKSNEIVDDYLIKLNSSDRPINSSLNNNNSRADIHVIDRTNNGSRSNLMKHYEYKNLKHKLRNKNNSNFHILYGFHNSTSLNGMDLTDSAVTNRSHNKKFFYKNNTYYHGHNHSHRKVPKGNTRLKLNITTSHTEASQPVGFMKVQPMNVKKIDNNDNKQYKNEYLLFNKLANTTNDLTGEKYSNLKNITNNKKDSKKDSSDKKTNLIEIKPVSKIIKTSDIVNINNNSFGIGNLSGSLYSYSQLNKSNSDIAEYVKARTILGDIFQRQNSMILGNVSADDFDSIYRSEILHPVEYKNISMSNGTGENSLMRYISNHEHTPKYFDFNNSNNITDLVDIKSDTVNVSGLKPIKLLFESKTNFHGEMVTDFPQKNYSDVMDVAKIKPDAASNLSQFEQLTLETERNIMENNFNNEMKDNFTLSHCFINTMENSISEFQVSVTNSNIRNTYNDFVSVSPTQEMNPTQNLFNKESIYKIDNFSRNKSPNMSNNEYDGIFNFLISSTSDHFKRILSTNGYMTQMNNSNFITSR